MQYAMLNEASGASDAPRLAKWQSIVVRHKSLEPSFTSVTISCKLLSSGQLQRSLFALLMWSGARWEFMIEESVAAEVASAGAQVALQLTPEQKERLLAARTYLLAQMMEIIQERTLIISMLQVLRKLHTSMIALQQECCQKCRLL